MTRIIASAPGKLVLLGEYAVLEGAQALVLAVNRRAVATYTTIAGDSWEIVSPTLGMRATLRLDAKGVAWHTQPPAELAWVGMLLERFPAAQGLPPCRIELDSDAFYFEHAGTHTKLGLGSSAALTVALLGALHDCAGMPPPSLDEGIRMHRAIQHGRGSGIDIAASLTGGLSRFQLHDAHTPQLDALVLPQALHWRCVYTGKATSTASMLATVAAWRQREPDAFAHQMHELATISSHGVDAVSSHDSATFLACIHDYADALARLGGASNADIVSREHQAIGRIAAGCGTAYKSCGAGGGDVGITFAVEDTRLREFSARVQQAGFPVIGLETDPMGLEVVSTA